MVLEIFYKTRVVYSGCGTDIDLQSYCKNTWRLTVAVVFPFIADGMDEDKLLITERIGWHIFRKLYEKLREVYVGAVGSEWEKKCIKDKQQVEYGV